MRWTKAAGLAGRARDRATRLLFVPSSSDADDELDVPSLEVAEEPALACDRANAAARRHPADCFSRCRRRSRQSQSPQRRDCEPSALLLLERGASHASAGRRPRRGEDLYECNVSDRQCCREPARSLLAPLAQELRSSRSAAGPRALGAVYQALADARARRARFYRGFSTYAGRGVSRMPLEPRGCITGVSQSS